MKRSVKRTRAPLTSRTHHEVFRARPPWRGHANARIDITEKNEYFSSPLWRFVSSVFFSLSLSLSLSEFATTNWLVSVTAMYFFSGKKVKEKGRTKRDLGMLKYIWYILIVHTGLRYLMEFTANNRGSLVPDIPSDSEVDGRSNGNTFKMRFLSV